MITNDSHHQIDGALLPAHNTDVSSSLDPLETPSDFDRIKESSAGDQIEFASPKPEIPAVPNEPSSLATSDVSGSVVLVSDQDQVNSNATREFSGVDDQILSEPANQLNSLQKNSGNAINFAAEPESQIHTELTTAVFPDKSTNSETDISKEAKSSDEPMGDCSKKELPEGQPKGDPPKSFVQKRSEADLPESEDLKKLQYEVQPKDHSVQESPIGKDRTELKTTDLKENCPEKSKNKLEDQPDHSAHRPESQLQTSPEISSTQKTAHLEEVAPVVPVSNINHVVGSRSVTPVSIALLDQGPSNIRSTPNEPEITRESSHSKSQSQDRDKTATLVPQSRQNGDQIESETVAQVASSGTVQSVILKSKDSQLSENSGNVFCFLYSLIDMCRPQQRT
jgi:hypothetical protein